MLMFVFLRPVAVQEVEVEKVHLGRMQLQTTTEKEKIVVFEMSEILEN